MGVAARGTDEMKSKTNHVSAGKVTNTRGAMSRLFLSATLSGVVLFLEISYE